MIHQTCEVKLKTFESKRKFMHRNLFESDWFKVTWPPNLGASSARSHPSKVIEVEFCFEDQERSHGDLRRLVCIRKQQVNRFGFQTLKRLNPAVPSSLKLSRLKGLPLIRFNLIKSRLLIQEKSSTIKRNQVKLTSEPTRATNKS